MLAMALDDAAPQQRIGRLQTAHIGSFLAEPFAPNSRSPIRTQSPARTTVASVVSSGGRCWKLPGENNNTDPG